MTKYESRVKAFYLALISCLKRRKGPLPDYLRDPAIWTMPDKPDG